MRRASRLSSKLVRIPSLVALLYSWHAGAFAGTPDAKVKTLSDFVREYVQQVNLLKTKLSEDALWTDKDRKPELLGYLRAAADLRAHSVAPVIVNRIAYASDPRYALDSLRLSGPAFPVYHALVQGGIPCVPFIVVELRRTYPKARTLDTLVTDLKRTALILCICEIYEQGRPDRRPGASQQRFAHGATLARKRLELELPETKDEDEKASLQAAIDGLKVMEDP